MIKMFRKRRFRRRLLKRSRFKKDIDVEVESVGTIGEAEKSGLTNNMVLVTDPMEVDDIIRDLGSHDNIYDFGGFFVSKEALEYGELIPVFGYEGNIPSNGKTLYRITTDYVDDDLIDEEAVRKWWERLDEGEQKKIILFEYLEYEGIDVEPLSVKEIEEYTTDAYSWWHERFYDDGEMYLILEEYYEGLG
jgi:hypothetical protein